MSITSNISNTFQSLNIAPITSYISNIFSPPNIKTILTCLQRKKQQNVYSTALANHKKSDNMSRPQSISPSFKQKIHELLDDSRFISKKTTTYIYTTLNQQIYFETVIGGISFHFTIIYNKPKHTQAKLDKLIKDILVILSLIFCIFKNDINQQTFSEKYIDVFLFLTPLKKKYTSQIPSSDDINSGYTQYYPNSSTMPTTVVLWREEEILKVLAHELIHALHIQPIPQQVLISMKNDIMKKIQIDYRDQNNNRKDIDLNETVTEKLAWEIQALFNAFENKSTYKKEKEIIHKHRNQIRNTMLITQKYKENGVFRQTTHAFEYNIL